jgi:hypothetical protein
MPTSGAVMIGVCWAEVFINSDRFVRFPIMMLILMDEAHVGVLKFYSRFQENSAFLLKYQLVVLIMFTQKSSLWQAGRT